MFCGHTHQPYVRELSGGSIRVRVQQKGMESASEEELQLPMRRIVNAGSLENHATDRLKQPTSCTTKRLELSPFEKWTTTSTERVGPSSRWAYRKCLHGA